MRKKEYVPHTQQGEEAARPPVELATQAIFQIGDTTIIATAHYQNAGKSCADRLVNILVEEVEKL